MAVKQSFLLLSEIEERDQRRSKWVRESVCVREREREREREKLFDKELMQQQQAMTTKNYLKEPEKEKDVKKLNHP